MGRTLFAVVRAPEWAVQKLGPIVAVFAATCILFDRPVAPAWLALVELLVGIAAGAIYVSLLNDATDRVQDRAAGKPNRLEGKSTRAVAVLLIVPIAIGIAVAILWRDDAALLATYGAAWLVFTLYSLRPFRLKERGLAGLFADATGAHVLPAMMAALIACGAIGTSPPPLWLGAVALWSLGYGLRGILWHQLADYENDRRIGVSTFAVRRGPGAAVRLARWIALPIELAAFAVMLAMLAAPIVLAMLLAYLVVAALRIRFAAAHYTIVAEADRFRLLMFEFYSLLLPLALLLASAANFPGDATPLLIFVLLFGPAFLAWWRDALYLPVRVVRWLVPRGARPLP